SAVIAAALAAESSVRLWPVVGSQARIAQGYPGHAAHVTRLPPAKPSIGPSATPWMTNGAALAWRRSKTLVRQPRSAHDWTARWLPWASSSRPVPHTVPVATASAPPSGGAMSFAVVAVAPAGAIARRHVPR